MLTYLANQSRKLYLFGNSLSSILPFRAIWLEPSPCKSDRKSRNQDILQVPAHPKRKNSSSYLVLIFDWLDLVRCHKLPTVEISSMDFPASMHSTHRCTWTWLICRCDHSLLFAQIPGKLCVCPFPWEECTKLRSWLQFLACVKESPFCGLAAVWIPWPEAFSILATMTFLSPAFQLVLIQMQQRS